MYTSHKTMHSPPGDRNHKQERRAVITGATSGIGKAFSEYFASLGYDLLLTGRRKDVLLDVALRLEVNYDVTIEIVFADLSKAEEISRLIQAVSNYNNIEVLVNCAGYGLDEKFSADEINHQIAMLSVHVYAPLRLTRQVLPAMMQNHRGIIINVSSLAAYLPAPGNAMYSSTKSFLKNFTESLHMDICNYGIRVQCLCPGFTHSDFHQHLSFPESSGRHGLFRWMEPEEIVSISIAGLNKGQVICIPGFFNKVLAVSALTVPRNIYYLIAAKMEQRIKKRSVLADAIHEEMLTGN